MAREMAKDARQGRAARGGGSAAPCSQRTQKVCDAGDGGGVAQQGGVALAFDDVGLAAFVALLHLLQRFVR